MRERHWLVRFMARHYEYVNGVLNKSTVRTETTRMVHCDFGWGGACNGYFVTGVFDFRGSDVVFDDPSDKGLEKTKYNNYIHIVRPLHAA